nr:ORF8 [Acipenserid herpesvirus 1]
MDFTPLFETTSFTFDFEAIQKNAKDQLEKPKPPKSKIKILKLKKTISNLKSIARTSKQAHLRVVRNNNYILNQYKQLLKEQQHLYNLQQVQLKNLETLVKKSINTLNQQQLCQKVFEAPVSAPQPTFVPTSVVPATPALTAPQAPLFQEQEHLSSPPSSPQPPQLIPATQLLTHCATLDTTEAVVPEFNPLPPPLQSASLPLDLLFLKTPRRVSFSNSSTESSGFFSPLKTINFDQLLSDDFLSFLSVPQTSVLAPTPVPIPIPISVPAPVPAPVLAPVPIPVPVPVPVVAPLPVRISRGPFDCLSPSLRNSLFYYGQ